MYSLKLVVKDQLEYEKLEDWITEEFMGNIVLVEEEVKPTDIHLAIFEVTMSLGYIRNQRKGTATRYLFKKHFYEDYFLGI
ncbi:MAG: hypothetical protein ACQEWE_00880 [Bacillota bacterium]